VQGPNELKVNLVKKMGLLDIRSPIHLMAGCTRISGLTLKFLNAVLANELIRPHAIVSVFYLSR
jgi:hypothetical protein